MLTDRERLIKLYIKGYITYKELLQYLEKINKLVEPPNIY